MYTRIIPSISYGETLGISLAFNVTAFEDLVLFTINGVQSKINAFRERKEKTSSQDSQLMNDIGPGMEIIKHAMYVSALNKSIVFEIESKKKIKELVLEVNALIEELSKYNSDFTGDSATERATITEEAIEYMNKMKW